MTDKRIASVKWLNLYLISFDCKGDGNWFPFALMHSPIDAYGVARENKHKDAACIINFNTGYYAYIGAEK